MQRDERQPAPLVARTGVLQHAVGELPWRLCGRGTGAFEGGNARYRRISSTAGSFMRGNGRYYSLRAGGSEAEPDAGATIMRGSANFKRSRHRHDSVRRARPSVQEGRFQGCSLSPLVAQSLSFLGPRRARPPRSGAATGSARKASRVAISGPVVNMAAWSVLILRENWELEQRIARARTGASGP